MKKFENEKEISGNMGFESKKLEKLMLETGWRKGEAWCMALVKAIMHKTFNSKKKKEIIDKVLNSGTQSSLANMRADKTGTFKEVSEPKKGDVVIWQKYKNCIGQNAGHAAIVLSYRKGKLKTIEGNTNEAGSREGTSILKKTRNISTLECNGLRLKGFFRVR